MPIVRCLLLSFLFAVSALAWNDEGHRTVALVAQRKLSPQACRWVTEVLRAHPEGALDLSSAAGWPDRVREDPEFHHQEWHYVNFPLFVDTPEHPVRLTGEVLPALNRMIRILKDRRAPARERAIALSWLVHLVGDVHQPLHAANGYWATFPRGDRGGGHLMVGFGQEMVKLHAFWDAAGGLYWKGVNHNRLDSIVDGLMIDYPIDARLQVRDAAIWAKESYGLAKDVVYPGVGPEQALSTEYIARSRQVAQDRMALAGYRLADLIERLAGAG